jgi:PAS domain S-box-containing protein
MSASGAGTPSFPQRQRPARVPWQRLDERLNRFPDTTCIYYIYDLVDQRKIYSSQSLTAMLGYAADEIETTQTLDLAELLHPDDLERVSQHFQRFSSLREGEIIDVVYRMKRADGQWCWLRSQETPLVQAVDGFPLQLLGVIQDITEHKNVESLLGSCAYEPEDLSETIVVTNREGKIEYVNRAWEQLTGYSRTEALGRTPAIVKSGQHDIAFYRKLWNTLQAGEVFRTQFINRKKNGELFYEQKTIVPIQDNRGKIAHFLSIGKDVTERRQTQKECSGNGNPSL